MLGGICTQKIHPTRWRNKILSSKMCKNKQHPFSKDNGLISKVWSKSASSTAFFSTLASLRTWSSQHPNGILLYPPTFGVGPYPSDLVLRNNGNKNLGLLVLSSHPSKEKWRFNQDDGCNETQRDTKNLQNIPISVPHPSSPSHCL